MGAEIGARAEQAIIEQEKGRGIDATILAHAALDGQFGKEAKKAMAAKMGLKIDKETGRVIKKTGAVIAEQPAIAA